MNRDKNKKNNILGLIIAGFLLTAWMTIEATDPYEGLWLKRTIFTKSFNFYVAVDVEFDGKPYRIERTIECYRKLVYGPMGSKNLYSDFPRYRAFGIKTETGEGIIVATPAACDGDGRKWERGSKRTNYNWHTEIPEDYTPLMMVADNPDNPQKIIIYASRQAYKSSKARLQYKGMTIEPAKGLGRWFADGPDKYAYYGNPKYDSLKGDNKINQHWWSVSYVPVGRDVWGHNEEIVKAVANKQGVVQLDRRASVLINTLDGYCHNFLYPFSGDGVMDSPSFRGERRKSDGCSSSYGYLLYQKLIPFIEGNDGVWRPDIERQGMDVVYRKNNEQKNGNEETSVWKRTIRIQDQEFDLIFEPDYVRGGRIFTYTKSSDFYFSTGDKIFHGVSTGLYTHKVNTF